ncbi:MAG: formylmethanofuran--tetrahydromethanopterin N-formyltransferase [Candidatus Altiarchaeota archaeon]|nr:formylmethanofuran--tetrahydromethanopterin N-formyltransferase [Candidatus Altiarchaeota archaeon]
MEIEDTFSEVFEMHYSEILVTAISSELALTIANNATGFATSVIGCDCEAGIDRLMESEQTPDDRPGVVVGFFAISMDKLKKSLLDRVGQSVLTAPSARVFNVVENGEPHDLGKKLSFFGDGHQKRIERYGRTMWSIPVMAGEFLVEENVLLSKGVSGNFQILGRSEEETIGTSMDAVNAINRIPGAITPFPAGICASGSKVGSRYPFLSASTDEGMCPSLEVNKLPAGTRSVCEIVIDAKDDETLRNAMKAGMGACNNTSTIKITAGNFCGKLGKSKIYLRRL